MIAQRHFEQELESLKTMLIKMGSVAEESIRSSIRAFLEKDSSLARRVMEREERINLLEIEIDNAIVDLLALQQPVAVDLRLILAAQKIDNDLERIGDHAVNIAESALAVAELPGADTHGEVFELPSMGRLAERMLQQALDAFIHMDAGLGMSVLTDDDTMDELNRKTVMQVVKRMKDDPGAIEVGMDLIRVSRNLERVADLATNIAEEVVFIAKARIVKHRAGERSLPDE
jgi:phosphate transport system protein